MSNVIVNRVKEFLQRFPPFSFLDSESLLHVAKSVEIRYFSVGEYLFKQGEDAQDYFFVLKEGQINLTENKSQGSVTAEICDEGDVFGVLALLGNRPYILTAHVAENSLVYAIPIAVFEELVISNSRVSLYFAAGFASGQVVVRTDLSQAQKARGLLLKGKDEHGLRIFSNKSEYKYSSDVLCCHADMTIETAAKEMSARDVGSIVVVSEHNHPIGIVTDKDIRTRVVATGLPVETNIKAIMSSPVVTRSLNNNFSDLYLTMIKNRLHHLVLTEAGTPESPVCGIISDHDILLAQENSPAALIHALMNTWDIVEMAAIRKRAERLLYYYLENEVSMDFVASIITEVNDLIIQKSVKLAQDKYTDKYPACKDIKFCLMSLGSEGREEQLLQTDIDNAIVFEDVEPARIEEVKAYMLLIGQEVIESMLACGYQSCPSDMMANNPRWCQPLSMWKTYFTDWIRTPDQQALMRASIFFDFRPVFGQRNLSEQLTDHIFNEITNQEVFLNFLAKNALLNPAPLGFFKNFLVEKSGAQKDKFDIKLRAMMPLADCARLLILSHRVVGINNTFKRFEKLVELEPNYIDLMAEAGKAYEILMRMRALSGLKHGTSGRYILPEDLGKLQRQLLKNAFAPIDELQKILRIRFQLDYFAL